MSLLSKVCAVAGLAVCVAAVDVAVDWSSDPSLAKSSRGTGGPPLGIDERAGSIGRHALGDRLSVVLGQDPVSSIAIATVRMGG